MLFLWLGEHICLIGKGRIFLWMNRSFKPLPGVQFMLDSEEPVFVLHATSLHHQASVGPKWRTRTLKPLLCDGAAAATT